MTNGKKGPNYRHGWYGTPEYQTWAEMKHRCTAAGARDYQRWGARGIRFCERWEKFENFILDMGPRPGPGYSLDRIDNYGPYAPENCRWATWKQQANNRSNTDLLTYDGRTMSLSAWAREIGLSQGALWRRIHKSGWSVRRAIGEPRHDNKVRQ